MKKNAIQMVCRLTGKLWLGMSGIRENMGHDDCLPYQADVFVMDSDNQPEGEHAFKKIGSIWNDGWGGDSNFTPLAHTTYLNNIIAQMREECAKHQMYWDGNPFGSWTLEEVCDSLACIWVDAVKDKKAMAKLAGRAIEWKFDDDPTVLNHPTKCQTYIFKA